MTLGVRKRGFGKHRYSDHLRMRGISCVMALTRFRRPYVGAVPLRKAALRFWDFPFANASSLFFYRGTCTAIGRKKIPVFDHFTQKPLSILISS